MARKHAASPSEPKPPPVLQFATEKQTKAAEAIVAALGEALKGSQHEMPGAHGKLAQFLSALINPAATSLAYRDHEGRPRAVTTFSNQVAAERQAAFTTLRAEGLSNEEIGDLVGLSRNGVQAVFERIEGKRAKQKRISLRDAERLEQAKSADLAVVPPAADEPIPTA